MNLSIALMAGLAASVGLSSAGFADDRPYRIVIVQDGPIDAAKRNKIAEEIRSASPFNGLGAQLNISFALGDPAQMNCHANATVDRVTECNEAYAGGVGGAFGADKVIALTDKGTGGGGSSVVTLSTSADPSIVVHELGHSIGNLDDEYVHTGAEIGFYCTMPRANRPNVAYFNPRMWSFPSDAVARSVHARDIPWYNEILSSTPIVSGTNLGSPSGTRMAAAGLFPGGPCETVIATWHSFQGENVMKDHGSKEFNPVQARAVLRAMEKARGARFTNVRYPARDTDPPVGPPPAAPSAAPPGALPAH